MTSILDEPTLVLNRNWQPIHVTSVRRALTLLCTDTARVVDPASFQLYDWEAWLAACEGGPIRSARIAIEAPEVIVLAQFDRVPMRQAPFSKRNVLRRDRFICQYCGRQPTADQLSIDHVVPRSAGGESTWDNCVAACVDCNHRKADRPLQASGLALRRAPKQPDWQPVLNRGNRSSWAPFFGSSDRVEAAS